MVAKVSEVVSCVSSEQFSRITRWAKRSEKGENATMDFERVNPLNKQLNLISGNLFPMTADGSRFTVGWRLYCVAVWLLLIIECIALCGGFAMVPKEKIINDGIATMLFIVEMFCVIARIHAGRRLNVRFVRAANHALREHDRILRRVVTRLVRQTQNPIKFYLAFGWVNMTIWIVLPLGRLHQADSFGYVDYKVPLAVSGQPFSATMLLLGTLLSVSANTFVLVKKIAMDSYVVHMVQLMTAQYRYIALKLQQIFQDGTSSDDGSEGGQDRRKIDQRIKGELRALCQCHNDVTRMSRMLKEMLSFYVSVMYVCNVVRYCGLGIMILDTASRPVYEYLVIFLYTLGSIVEQLMMCFCVQELLDASKELTDEAFHEDWFRCGLPIKRTFLSMTTANSLECKLAKVGNIGLSLPSFLMILKQAYSFAVLFLKVRHI